jgi:hypothetical protein
LLLAGCSPQEEPLFRMLPPSETRIQFRNTLSEQPTPHQTELLFEYFSNLRSRS